MNEVCIMQFSSKLCYITESMCSLDASSTKRSSNRQAVPIIGKKIISEGKVAAVNEQSPPCKIFEKTPTRKRSLSMQKTSPKKGKKLVKRTVLEKPTKQGKNSEKKTDKGKMLRKIVMSEKPGNEKVSPQPRSIFSRSPKKDFDVKELEKKMNTLIKTSLRKERLDKIRRERAKKDLEHEARIKISERMEKNTQIRKENKKSKKKQENYRRKRKNSEEKSENLHRRTGSTGNNTSRKQKSSERVETGLNIIKEIQAEIGGFHLRSQSFNQKFEKTVKSSWKPNPEVKQYMKKKNLIIKRHKNFENLQKFAEESTTATQLNILDSMVKASIEKNIGKQFRTKKTGKNPEKNLKKSENSEVFYENLELVYDQSDLESEKSLKFLDINKKIDAIGEISPLPSSFNSVQDFETNAAIKIQSVIRMFLVKKRLERENEVYSVDEQIVDIIHHKLLTPDHPKELKILTNQVITYPDEIRIEISPSQSSESLSFFQEKKKKNSEIEELIKNIEEKTEEYQEILKEQDLLREAQIENLLYLKAHEINSVKLLVEHSGQNSLREILDFVIEKRFSQLLQIFAKSKTQKNLPIPKETFKKSQEQLKHSLEEPISRSNCSSSSLFENAPIIANPKSQLSMIGDISEIQLIHENANANPSSPAKDSILIQESTINQGSDEESQLSFNIFISTPSSSSLGEMEKLQILSPPTRPKISGPAFISPTFEGESIEGSLEFSTSLLPYDSNLLESISPEGFFCRTPDYMPDRPSAPMTFFSSPDSSKITAEFNGNDSIFNIFQDVEVDAEFVSSISEQILFELLVNVLRENLKSPKENICINTDFLSIENYINQIFSQCDHAAVLSLLHTPLKKDPLEVLSELQEFGIGSISEAQVWVPDLISVEVYLNIENPEEAMKFADHPLEIQQILTEAQHIHDKMVFDTVNSLMQKHRFPEIPLPWTPSLIVPPHHLTLENIFKNIKAEICKYCSEDFFLIYENGENFQIIRDERQLKLLNTEILESEPDWINYDNEYTQIRLDSADMVFDYLVEEAIGLLA